MIGTWPPREIPIVPEAIQEAGKDGSLVLFNGAGTSRLMGCPSWPQLANASLRQLAAHGLLTYGEIHQLSHLDSKKKLSIALHVSVANDVALDFDALVLPKAATNSKVYDYLNSIGCVYVTTNYDRYLDRAPTPAHAATVPPSEVPFSSKSELICMPEQFEAKHLRRPGTVIHLHGSLDNPPSMIMSTPQYLAHYEDDRIQHFLEQLFAGCTILFVGYGLDEWEILEHVLRKGKSQQAKSTPHFMLMPFYSYQERTYQHLREYYLRAFNVRLIPYSIDHLDYAQLERVIEDWAKQIEIGSPLLTDDLAFVKEVASE
jgi:hypothetical protein